MACEYAKRKENLLLGPLGMGKNHLAAALRVRAVQNGFSAFWLTTDNPLFRLRWVEENSSRLNRRGKYLSSGSRD